MRKKALGKGLEALLPPTQNGEYNKLLELSLDKIDPNPQQPRRSFEEGQLSELAESIRANGVLQPIIVQPKRDRYIIIVGERRVRAARLAGQKKIPALIRKYDDNDLLKLALIENIQREDLTPIEQALAFKEFMRQFDITQEELAKQLGKDRSVIANTMRLLKLPSALQQKIQSGELPQGHARNLLAIRDTAEQIEIADRIIRESWSVRQTEQFVQKQKRRKKTSKKVNRGHSDDVFQNALKEKLTRHLETKVVINVTPKGGQIVINYYDDDDLTRLVNRIIKQ